MYPVSSCSGGRLPSLTTVGEESKTMLALTTLLPNLGTSSALSCHSACQRSSGENSLLPSLAALRYAVIHSQSI